MRIRALPAAMLAGFALLSAGFTASADAGAIVVAATVRGHLVEVTATGSIERVIAGPDVTGGKVGSISVSDRQVFFARHEPAVGLPCDATVARVPLTGGPAETIARGFAPAVRADGQWLAYVAAEPGNEGCDFSVRALDLNTGDSRTWGLDGAWRGYYGVCNVAWARSGRSLAVELCSEADSVTHLVDAGASGLLDDGTLAGPADGSLSWATPAPGPREDSVAVVERCCLTGDPRRLDQRVRFLNSDRPGGLGVPADAGWVRSLDVDLGGRAVVVAGGRGRLMISNGERLEAVGEGFVSARWLAPGLQV